MSASSARRRCQNPAVCGGWKVQALAFGSVSRALSSVPELSSNHRRNSSGSRGAKAGSCLPCCSVTAAAAHRFELPRCSAKSRSVHSPQCSTGTDRSPSRHARNASSSWLRCCSRNSGSMTSEPNPAHGADGDPGCGGTGVDGSSADTTHGATARAGSGAAGPYGDDFRPRRLPYRRGTIARLRSRWPL